MTYKVIGLMSGSSLDGLDIAYVHLTEQRGAWSFELKAADCIPYPTAWAERLKALPGAALREFILLHSAYGRYLGECVNAFLKKNGLSYAVDFISSHGHTAFHEPSNGATFQIGDGSAIAATTGLSTITDLRAMDVALGGQGAPIVPIGDKLLFPGYDYWLNLGGIANITIKNAAGELSAFDICACNQVLNSLAARAGKGFDEDGLMARSGTALPHVLAGLNAQPYFSQAPPKSLSNEAAMNLGAAVLANGEGSTEDLLHTFCRHIAGQIGATVQPGFADDGPKKMLVSGGGGLNIFLVEQIKAALEPAGVELVVPAADIIRYKEAIVMAFLGALRWRADENVLASVTGASRDSIGGAIWAGV